MFYILQGTSLLLLWLNLVLCILFLDAIIKGIVFLKFFLDSLLKLNRKSTLMCLFDFVYNFAVVIYQLLQRCVCVCVDSLGLSLYRILFSVMRHSSNSIFPIWMYFISFSCLIAVAETSSTVLHSGGQAGTLVLFLILGENSQSLTIEYDVEYTKMSFINLMKFTLFFSEYFFKS